MGIIKAVLFTLSLDSARKTSDRYGGNSLRGTEFS